MNKRYPLGILTLIFIMSLLISACSGAADPNEIPGASEAESPKTEVSSPSSSEEKMEEAATRPSSESFELMTAEGNQTMEAVLQEGDGFSLYVFEKFTFDSAASRLALTSNPDYYVDIEPLPPDYDAAELEAAGREELRQVGEVFDYSGELVEHPLIFAEVYLQVSGEKGIVDYIVWDSKDGGAFLFRLHHPKGEVASDFAGPVLVSLSTVQSDMQ